MLSTTDEAIIIQDKNSLYVSMGDYFTILKQPYLKRYDLMINNDCGYPHRLGASQITSIPTLSAEWVGASVDVTDTLDVEALKFSDYTINELLKVINKKIKRR